MHWLFLDRLLRTWLVKKFGAENVHRLNMTIGAIQMAIVLFVIMSFLMFLSAPPLVIFALFCVFALGISLKLRGAAEQSRTVRVWFDGLYQHYDRTHPWTYMRVRSETGERQTFRADELRSMAVEDLKPGWAKIQVGLSSHAVYHIEFEPRDQAVPLETYQQHGTFTLPKRWVATQIVTGLCLTAIGAVLFSSVFLIMTTLSWIVLQARIVLLVFSCPLWLFGLWCIKQGLSSLWSLRVDRIGDHVTIEGTLVDPPGPWLSHRNSQRQVYSPIFLSVNGHNTRVVGDLSFPWHLYNGEQVWLRVTPGGRFVLEVRVVGKAT